MKKLAILGSTGSIGCSTLQVVAQQRHQFQIEVLVAGQNVDCMEQQCRQFKPRYAIMATEVSANALYRRLKTELPELHVLHGVDAACQAVSLPEVDYVVSAIVGAIGLKPTLSAIEAGKRILLANKESLVTCGHLFMDAVQQFGAELLPIDSEHNAIFQSLPEILQRNLGQLPLQNQGVVKLILTGSGGPFRDYPLKEFHHITVEQACAHPNWSMGQKISVDSATMMNKGLEYIELRWLFGATAEQVEIIIHPQSIIHSMVQFIDGSVIAQLGSPDMRTPIAHALGYPQRIHTDVTALNFTQLKALTFLSPDYTRYPCLKLAIDAFSSGQAATTVLNATNEELVAAFLRKQIKFTDIARLNELCLMKQNFDEPLSIDEVLTIDLWARNQVRQELLK